MRCEGIDKWISMELDNNEKRMQFFMTQRSGELPDFWWFPQTTLRRAVPPIIRMLYFTEDFGKDWVMSHNVPEEARYRFKP